MKKIILFFIFCILSILAFSQDVIIKRTGDKIQANVIEITENTIKYKRFEEEDGPLRNIAISEITEIIYNNGEWEKFNEENINTNTSNIDKSDPFFNNGLYIDGIIGGGIALEKKTIVAFYDDYGNYFPNGINYTTNNDDGLISLGLRIGHKWYLGQVYNIKNIEYKYGIQLQWARLAMMVSLADGPGSYSFFAISPLNFGFTNIFKFNEDNGIEANIIGGVSFGNEAPPPLFPEEIEGGISYGIELKYRLKRFAIGIDYTRMNMAMNYSERKHNINLLSITAGLKL